MELPVDPLADVWDLDPPPRLPAPTIVRPVPIDRKGKAGPTRGQSRGPHWRRSAPGLFVPITAEFDQPAQRIVEAAGLLPAAGAVTGWAALHLAGARFFDGRLADGSEIPVGLAMTPHGHRSRVPGVVQDRRAFTPDEVTRFHDVRCLIPHRALLDEMCDRDDLRGAVKALEMACFGEFTSVKRFRAYLERQPRRPGIVLARQATALAVEGHESPPECDMRLAWELDAELPRPLCNRTVYDLNGRFLGRPDLLDVEAGLVGEYDGEHHLRQRRADIGREEGFRNHGLEYFSVVAGELHDRDRMIRKMQTARARALASGLPRRWTIEPSKGRRSRSLDERIEARERFGKPDLPGFGDR